MRCKLQWLSPILEYSVMKQKWEQWRNISKKLTDHGANCCMANSWKLVESVLSSSCGDGAWDTIILTCNECQHIGKLLILWKKICFFDNSFVYKTWQHGILLSTCMVQQDICLLPLFRGTSLELKKNFVTNITSSMELNYWMATYTTQENFCEMKEESKHFKIMKVKAAVKDWCDIIRMNHSPILNSFQAGCLKPIDQRTSISVH